MITILSGLFIKNRDQFGNSDVRRAYGMLCSIVGIALNVFLFAGKYLAGVISGSIAITADAFNNLSDAGSSFISLVGFKFSGMKADADHPFGHGRIEYVSGFGVSMVIILMGNRAFSKTSIEKDLSSGAGGDWRSGGGDPCGLHLCKGIHVLFTIGQSAKRSSRRQ